MTSTSEPKTIWAVICDPGKPPRLESIQNDLPTLQALVGGYIETVTLADDLIAIVDEEGMLKGKPQSIYGLRGTVVFVSARDDCFVDLKPRHRRMLLGGRA